MRLYEQFRISIRTVRERAARTRPSRAGLAVAHKRERALRHSAETRPWKRPVAGAGNLTLDMPEQGRVRCQFRDQCHRGCSYGAYFSTQAVTLPMARATGNLTLKGDSVVESLEYDAAQQRVTGVRVSPRLVARSSTDIRTRAMPSDHARAPLDHEPHGTHRKDGFAEQYSARPRR